MRTTIAEINEKNLRHNIQVIRKHAPNSAILAVVKANAYGHGIVGCSRILRKEGVEYLGVAFPDEAVEIRNSGDYREIIVIYPTTREDCEVLCEYNLQTVTSSLDVLERLSEEARKHKKTIKTHLFLNTGMNRDGIPYTDALKFMRSVEKIPNIDMCGILTHFAESDVKNSDFTLLQLKRFNDTVNLLESKGYKFTHKHTANSGAIANYPEAHFNLVRPGISIHGLMPSRELAEKMGLKPTLSLKSRVLYEIDINEGDSVGYGRLFISDKKTRIVVVPIGYGDGLSRILTNKTQCLINGSIYNIVGSVCMDLCMVDVGDGNVKIDDEVILIGSQNGLSITPYDHAESLGTIPYEVTTLISRRVPRVYVSNGVPEQ